MSAATPESVVIMADVAVKVGWVFVDRVVTRPANDVVRELGQVNGQPDLTGYFVDLCFQTYVENGLGASYAAGTGIHPMSIGRKQLRFTIGLEVPPSLPDHDAYRAWIDIALREAAQLTREYLARKRKAYPAEQLANEIDNLRDRWRVHVTCPSHIRRSP